MTIFEFLTSASIILLSLASIVNSYSIHKLEKRLEEKS